MKTKEEFLQAAYGYKFEEDDFLNPAIRITLNAMEKYAQEVVNNLDKADVIKCDGDERKALLIDFLSWYRAEWTIPEYKKDEYSVDDYLFEKSNNYSVVSGSLSFKEQMKQDIIPRVWQMAEKEKEHLNWLIDNNAPKDMIETSSVI
jgi:hypothetical protein